MSALPSSTDNTSAPSVRALEFECVVDITAAREMAAGGASMSATGKLPLGCGAELTKRQSKPLIGRVNITYFCTACGETETVSVRWRSHHALPIGWRCRDIVPTNELPRRTDHIFSCSPRCRTQLDMQYPPPTKPKWFASS